MEDERTKELAYLLDREETEMENAEETVVTEPAEVPGVEEKAPVPEEKKVLTKEEKQLEKQKMKKRSKERFPKKTVMNLNYRIDKTTGPATVLLYVILVGVVLLAVAKFGVLDVMQKATNLEKELAGIKTDVETMTTALKDYNTVKGEYNRYTQGYLQKSETPIDRLEILDVLEQTVFAGSNMLDTSIVEDGIFIKYTGLDLEGTSALVRQLEAYPWVKDVVVQSATLAYNEVTGMETITTTMLIETYATPEEVPANE